MSFSTHSPHYIISVLLAGRCWQQGQTIGPRRKGSDDWVGFIFWKIQLRNIAWNVYIFLISIAVHQTVSIAVPIMQVLRPSDMALSAGQTTAHLLSSIRAHDDVWQSMLCKEFLVAPCLMAWPDLIYSTPAWFSEWLGFWLFHNSFLTYCRVADHYMFNQQRPPNIV